MILIAQHTSIWGICCRMIQHIGPHSCLKPPRTTNQTQGQAECCRTAEQLNHHIWSLFLYFLWCFNTLKFSCLNCWTTKASQIYIVTGTCLEKLTTRHLHQSACYAVLSSCYIYTMLYYKESDEQRKKKVKFNIFYYPARFLFFEIDNSGQDIQEYANVIV